MRKYFYEDIHVMPPNAVRIGISNEKRPVPLDADPCVIALRSLEAENGSYHDGDGIRTVVVEHRLPFQTCREFAYVGYIEVDAAAQIASGFQWAV